MTWFLRSRLGSIWSRLGSLTRLIDFSASDFWVLPRCSLRDFFNLGSHLSRPQRSLSYFGPDPLFGSHQKLPLFMSTQFIFQFGPLCKRQSRPNSFFHPSTTGKELCYPHRVNQAGGRSVVIVVVGIGVGAADLVPASAVNQS